METISEKLSEVLKMRTEERQRIKGEIEQYRSAANNLEEHLTEIAKFRAEDPAFASRGIDIEKSNLVDEIAILRDQADRWEAELERVARTAVAFRLSKNPLQFRSAQLRLER